MLAAPIPANETQRLETLWEYGILDTPPEPAFDRLTQILQAILEVPTVLVSLVDSDRQWFKSCIGLGTRQTPREPSFCGHAVFLGQPLIVPDATRDERFFDNPFVTGDLGLRFYAGIPLIAPNGQILGTLCAIDYVPRPCPTAQQLTIMQNLADAVMSAMEVYRFAQLKEERATLSDVMTKVASAAHHAHDLDEALAACLPILCHYSQHHDAIVYERHAMMRECFISKGRWRLSGDGTHFQLSDSPTPWPIDADKLLGELAPGTRARRIDESASLGRTPGVVFHVQNSREETHWVIECHGSRPPSSNALMLADFVGAQLSHVFSRKQVEQIKNEFIANVSHELRTPLTSIFLSLQLLDIGKGGALPDKAAHMIEIAVRNSERLVRLVNDILDIEKIESGHMVFEIAPHSIAPLVERAILETEGFARGLDVKFHFENQASDTCAMVDVDRFMQVMANLLSNAVKFSPPGQTVFVAVMRWGDRLRVRVQDHGPGVPLDMQDRIFEKFTQGHDIGSGRLAGTGLGLAIVKQIAERMQADIGLESTPGDGATFFVDFFPCSVSEGH